MISTSFMRDSWDKHRYFVLMVAALVMLLPYVGVYLANLWQLPHYQFFPLLLAAVAYLVWERSRAARIAQVDFFATFLLGCGTLLALVSALFVSSWMGYTAFLFLLAAVLYCVIELGTNRRIISLLLPLLLIWQPPLSINNTADGKLIQQLQVVSAHLSSMWLDFLGFIHYRPGTVLQLPEKSFGVAEACSGVQSFFALLSFAALIVVFQRRKWIHALLLLGSSVFWAVLMNTVRITAIPISFELFGVDLSEGLIHDILGYTTMGLALLLLVSTDQLLLSFLPASAEEHSIETVDALSTADGHEQNISSDARIERPTILGRFVPAAVCVLLLPVFAMQGMDVYSSWGQQRKAIEFFQDDVFIDMQANDAPSDLGDWKFIDYQREDRSRAADLGERSDVWKYQANSGLAIISFDQAFPGWHELSVCYQVSGWTLKSRQVVILEDKPDWPAVAFELQRGSNEYAYVIFAMFDNSRVPMQPPGAWGGWNAIMARIQNRLSPRVRGSLFTLAGYQVQLFYSYQSTLSEETRASIRKQFSTARESILAAAKN